MIRINLLPYKESTLIQWGQRQVLLFVVALLVSGVICVIWAQRLPDPQKKKKELIAERVRYETRTREVKARKTCNQSRYKKNIRKANRKYKAIERLITQRRTPKFVLRELSRILSEAWGPSLKPNLAGKDKRTLFNANWDPTAVWITRFEEKDNQLKLEGGAKAMDDVAEFWRRLQVSAYFQRVDLEKFKKVKKSKDAKEAYLEFSIIAKVSY
jgi:Tfp pilus assembly protein PilN